MNRSTVKARQASYVRNLNRAAESRETLRQAVLAWKAKGATIVEMADALQWSRQSVYDLIGK